MDWQAISSLTLASLGNALILAMTAVLSTGLALRLFALTQPRSGQQKQPK